MATTLNKLLTRHRISLTIHPGSIFIPVADRGAKAYTIKLTKGKAKLVYPQADRKRKQPSITTVMKELLADAVMFDDTKTYDGWCDVCGCDPADDLSQREYKQLGWMVGALKGFLGPELYADAVKAFQKK